jgi:hypothetical protein
MRRNLAEPFDAGALISRVRPEPAHRRPGRNGFRQQG